MLIKLGGSRRQQATGNSAKCKVQTKEFGVWRSEARGSEIGGDHEKDAPYVVNLVEISGARTNG